MKIFGLSELILIIFLSCLKTSAQQSQWIWIKGDSINNSVGHFGVKGVPNILNTPPALTEANGWRDLSGNFWMFAGSSSNGSYSDLWKYDVTSNMWTWMNGPGVIDQLPVYGIQGTPDSMNNPGVRTYGFCTWTDTIGNLWLFGGLSTGFCNDLWKYDVLLNEWTWMKGSNSVNDTGSYGTQGISSPTNNPPARMYTSCAWTDENDNLWFYGGSGKKGDFNDLWKYNIQNNEWTWVNGSKICGSPPIHGIKGVSSPLNTPGARYIHSRWKDPQGNFIFMGGKTTWTNVINDMWKYDPQINEWTWLSGCNLGGAASICAWLCDTSMLNTPGARLYNTACWTDKCGVIYNFGGIDGSNHVLGDLWSYNTISGKWTLVHGNLNLNPPAIYGMQGIPNINNSPGGRAASCAWSDLQGNFYLFGGTPNNQNGNLTKNDLWKFIPDTNCPFGLGLGNITVSNDTTICKGDSIQLFSSGGLHYSWLPDININNSHIPNPIVYPLTSTVYSVVISNDGCAKKRQIHVKVLNDTIMKVLNNDTSLCKGQSIQINATGGLQYIWNTNETTSNINVNPLTPTIYIVTITDSNGCRKTDSITILVNPLPVLQLNPQPSSICLGDSITLNATGAITYTWSPSFGLSTTTSNNVIASPSSTTKYQIIGKDSNTCEATDSLLVTVYSLPIINVTPSESCICDGDSVVFIANGGINYFWTPSTWLLPSIDNTMVAVPHQDVVYTISGTDINNCTNSTKAKVTVYTIPITLSDTAILCLGNSLILNAGAINGCQFIWQDGLQGQTYTVNEPGKYWVTSTMNNCKRIDSVDVLICTDIWVANAFTPGSDGINDIFIPKASTDLRYYQFRIYNRWGELLFESNDINKGWNGSYKNESCQQGVYVWTIVYEGINQPGKATLKGTVTLIK